MKLSNYIENLNKIFDKEGDLDVVYAVDDEGNDYLKVEFSPTIAYFENLKERYLQRVDESEKDEYDVVEKALIIN